MKLGKKPPKYDPRTLLLSKYLDILGLPPIPEIVDWTQKVSAWGMMLNDEIGCCAVAGPGHMIQTWTANAGQEFVPSDEDILKAYRDISGYVPGKPHTDIGCYMLDVLNYWRKTGIAGHRIVAFAKVNQRDLKMVKAACYIFGGLIGGFALPMSVEKQMRNDELVWEVEGDPNDPRQDNPAYPGTLGGHCMPWLAFQMYVAGFSTWADIQASRFDWPLWYCDELYACVSQDWLDKNGMAPPGLNIEQLMEDLLLVTG